MLINTFIIQKIFNIYTEQRESNILIRANILANSIRYHLAPGQILEPLGTMSNIIENYSKEINSRIIVVNMNSIVKGDSNEELIGTKLNHDEIQSALKGNVKSNIYNFEKYGHVLYVAVPVMFRNEVVGSVLISTSIDDIYNETEDINRKLLTIYVTSILIIAIIIFLFSDFIFRPIGNFTKAIIDMTKGDFKHKITINTNDEFKKMADAFNSMLLKLDQVDKQRNDFVANVSHELRTPLSSIKLLSESLLHQNETNILIYKEFLRDIDSEVDRLNQIIEELLALVDLDEEKLKLNYKTTYINFLLEKIINKMKPLAQKKNISLTYKQSEKIQMKIDSDKIQQAVINIIHNAIKYTQDNGSVDVSLYLEENYVVIEIKDNGIGIPKSSLGNIFDRFYRVDKARTRNTGGTGLGLSIAHQIVTLHQGTIELESEVGEGSTFYIKIPYNITMAK